MCDGRSRCLTSRVKQTCHETCPFLQSSLCLCASVVSSICRFSVNGPRTSEFGLLSDFEDSDFGIQAHSPLTTSSSCDLTGVTVAR